MKRWWSRGIGAIIVAVTLFLVTSAFGADITFQWDGNSESDLAGYRLYQSAVSQQYPSDPIAIIERGPNPGGTETYTLENVPDGLWHWVLTAFDTDHYESGYSNEVWKTVGAPEAPGAPQNLIITNNNNGGPEMAFPVIEATISSNDGGGTEHTVNLPASIEVGELLLALFSSDDNESVGWPGGWTGIFTLDGGAQGPTLSIAYRIATGSEGSSIIVTTGSDEATASIVCRISGHDSGNAPEVSAGVTGSGTTVDPDSLTPSGGAKDYLWFAIEANDDGTNYPTVFPTNYNDNQIISQRASTAGCTVSICTRDLNAGSEDPGAFTLNGSEQHVTCTLAIFPGGLAQYALNVNPGNYGITGKAVIGFYDRIMPLDEGGYDISGINTILQYNRMVTAVPGNYGIAGQPATLLRDALLPLAEGSYDITGQVAALAKNRILNVDSGSYIITGAAAQTLCNRLLNVINGSYDITGQAATLTHTISGYTLNVNPGSYVISGKSVICLRGLILPAESGTYGITGTPNDMDYSRIMVANSGSYLITGIEAAALYGRVMAVESGSYEITGQQLNALFTRVLQALGGSYTIDGKAANLFYDRIMALGSGVYTISGKNATLYYFSGGMGGLAQLPLGSIIILIL